MRRCFAIELETPKKYRLRGLWFGSLQAKTVFIFLHGLSGSAFSMGDMLDRLVTPKSAVLSFNNRGFEWVSTLRRGKSKRSNGGAAHEIFTDCVDDIDGAIRFAKRQGAKKIYLVGHSTGCQKSIYWASKRNGGRGVAGILLFGPISDYEAEVHRKGKSAMEKAIRAAKSLVARGKKHDFLQSGTWYEHLDAQRFLSLYEPQSAENIFPYGRPTQKPRALEAVKAPVLAIWADKDEYSDRESTEVKKWFEKHVRSRHRFLIVPGVGHGFKGAEKKVAGEIQRFIQGK